MGKGRLRLLLAFALAAAVVTVPSALAGQVEPLTPSPSSDAGPVIEEATGLWFVELASPPSVEGTPVGVLRQEKQNFRAAAKAAGVPFSERYAFDTLWNGLSVRTSRVNAKALEGVAGVKRVYPVVRISVPETAQASPELATALAMTGADVAQADLGLSGEGIKVAVMDTGIDYNHPDLGGGWGNRVTHGWDFVGDDFNAAGTPEQQIPQPDDDPMDCNGHGTHVAGIVGASGAVTGVAPGVTFGAYKVFGCEGSTFADIMIAAMEMALADGMDVLNMSIGSAFQWPQYPTGVASDHLVDQGMVVVASAGNSGASGVYSMSSPGNGHKVIGVASYDNTHVELNVFTVTPANLTIGYSNAAAAPPAPTEGSLPLAKTGTPASAADACEPIAADLTGHAVLIRRGTCTFYAKARHAELAGAAAVVLYNNVPGRFAATVAVQPGDADGQPVTIPVVSISDVEGVAINNAIEAEPQTLNWTDETGTFDNPTAGLISSFSSFGHSPDLDLKPDLGAPGGLIRSTYPLAQGGYATVSGTSMSAPHVAGAAALVLEAKPDTAAEEMRPVLQNSAVPAPWWGNPGLGFLDNVHRQGAGMINIPVAVTTGTTVFPGKLALGEGEAGPQTRTLTIRNTGATAVTYDLSFVNALSTGPSAGDPTGTFVPGYFLGNASVAFSAPTVTVPAGGTATVQATITPAVSPNLGQYGGYIVLQGGGETFRVPYAGFIGDYQQLVVLRPEASPWGNPLLRGSLTFGPSEPVTINPAAGEVAYLLVHLGHQSRAMRAQILDASGRPVHPVFSDAFRLEYLARNASPTGFFVFTWDGTRMHSAGRGHGAADLRMPVPAGQYTLRLSILKALGDPANPAHVETWESPPITVVRPHPGRGRG